MRAPLIRDLPCRPDIVEIALAVEVLGEESGPLPALPADFQPDAIRQALRQAGLAP
mgnify:CR=1 FL=1